MSDLLTVELAKHVELVERERIDLALRELRLDELFGSAAVKDRLSLGELLTADALLLLSLDEQAKQKSIRLVICDCRYGARLKVDSLVFSTDAIDGLVEQCLAAVQHSRARFKTGVDRFIGVTPFLAKSLSNEFDHLQSAFAALVQDGLLNYPGVAVVELDEARAIARELALRGEELETTIMPMFVEGEFEVARGRDGDDLRVRLTARARDGEGEVRQWRLDEPLGRVAAELSNSIPAKILEAPRDKLVAPLDRRQQQQAMVNRAEAFARLGLWKQSTALREAALLLDPRDVETRVALVVDYDLWIAETWFNLGPPMRAAMKDPLTRREQIAPMASASEQQLERFGALTHHVEYLVKQRLLNPREASLVVYGSVKDLLSSQPPLVSNHDAMRNSAEQFFWRCVPQFQGMDFELRGGALHPTLDRWFGHTRPGELEPWRGGENDARGWSKRRQIEAFTNFAWIIIYRTFALPPRDDDSSRVEFDDSRTLDQLYRLVTEATPPEVPLGFMAAMACGRFRASELLYERLGVAEVRAFYERLRATKVPMYEFYARCGTLGLKVARNEPLERTALREVTDLIEEFHSRKYLSLDEGQTEPFETNLAIMRRMIAERLNGVARKRHALPTNWIPRDDPQRRVRFAPIEGLPADALAITKCTDSLDLLRSRETVYVMREKGVVRRIFADDSLQDAVWDGQRIWIATLNTGIHVYSPAGEKLGRLRAADGLPLSDKNSLLRLHAVSPGRCIALGKLSQNGRLWFAELSSNEQNELRAKVFHTAAVEPPDQTRNRPANEDADADELFYPTFLLRYTHPDRPNVDWLLIGREGGHHLEGRQPLALDLNSRHAFILPVAIHPRALVIADRGDIVAVNENEVRRISPPLPTGEEWTTKIVHGRGRHSRYGPSGFLLRHEGKIVNGGETWRLLDERLQQTWLAETALPKRYHFRFYGLSAHYGIVGWHYGDQFYRASIDDSPPLTETADTMFPFVPAEARQRHADAVREMERLGGCVGSSIFRNTSSGVTGWHTVVYLPRQWSGGDAGLAHLKDLHQLHTLQLVQAAVTNEGMKHVGELTTLSALDLVETNVTDEGLPELAKLQSLVRIRLEGAGQGEQFSDDGLVHLARLKQLQMLEIYGPAFTDDGLRPMAKMPRLGTLRLFSTSMTKDRLNEFAKTRRSFRWFDYVANGN
ncbi:MAG: hypothetical protein RIC55_05270 [Pirellulaceae bacterium]